MIRVSIGKLKSLSSIHIVVDESTRKYYVELHGMFRDGTTAAGLLDEGWNTLEQAMICANGIAKMFKLPASFPTNI